MGASYFKHLPAALLRAATAPLSALPDTWPDLNDARSCRTWLDEHCTPELTAAITQASPELAAQLASIRVSGDIPARKIRRTTRSVLRYVLRATGRATPNGLLAGVAPARFDDSGAFHVRGDHQMTARVDSKWLHDVVTQLEKEPDVLSHLRVTRSNLVTCRGDRLYVPNGRNRFSFACTPALAVIHAATIEPVTVQTLLDRLAEDFPTGSRQSALGLISTLLAHRFLISHLRAPSTATDPLTHVLSGLLTLPTASLTEIGLFLSELTTVASLIHEHNDASAAQQPTLRADLVDRMNRLAATRRSPIALDLALDCDLVLPHRIGREAARAASALLRLTHQPAGKPAWQDYHRRFLDRYGRGTLVPLADLLDPDAGLGYPAGFPGSLLSEPMQAASPRDRRLLTLAVQALVDGTGEITLTDADLDALSGDVTISPPPHVELAVQIHAASTHALNHGDYRLTVSPARSVGTLTGRFTHLAPHLVPQFQHLPAATTDTTRTQLTFTPAFPANENICRVPGFLDRRLPLGEHDPQDHLALADLMVTATEDRLHLVHNGQVIEPVVFHALALDKQAAPLVHFLSQLPRAFTTSWTWLDWGQPAADLPALPRVTYGRAVLAPARWRLDATDLPAELPPAAARLALDAWRLRWHCPTTVALHEDDRSLRLSLDIPAHVDLVRDHLRRHDHAVLTESVPPCDLDWIGHAHDVVIPLVTTSPPRTAPDVHHAPVTTNRDHGQFPASPHLQWLSVKIFTHPERINDLLINHLPQLLWSLDRPRWWFIRYRSPGETDHLRLRIRTPGDRVSAASEFAALSVWFRELQSRGVTSRITLDSYYPEAARYGGPDALAAAEAVFAADSAAVAQAIPATTGTMPPEALAAVGIVHIARSLLGDKAAFRWLIDHKATMQPASPQPLDRAIVDYTTRLALADDTTYPTEWPTALTDAWRYRTAALHDYARRLPTPVPDNIVDSLLHMHHNRVIGPDRASEHLTRRLARAAALTARDHEQAKTT